MSKPTKITTKAAAPKDDQVLSKLPVKVATPKEDKPQTKPATKAAVNKDNNTANTENDTVADASSTKNASTTKPAPKRIKMPDQGSIIMVKYQSGGWQTVKLFNKGAVNIMATKGEGAKQKVHFIRLAKIEDVSQEETNVFIQNAFSNAAVPVYAHVIFKLKNDEYIVDKIHIEDVNQKIVLRIVAEKKT